MKRITTLLFASFLMVIGLQSMAEDFKVAIFTDLNPAVSIAQSPEYPWIVNDGCLSSSNKTGLKTSWFSITLDVAQEEELIGFDYKVESWGAGETFIFSIDEQNIITAHRTDWTTASHSLTKGKHTLKWTYTLSGGYQSAFAYLRNFEIGGVNLDTFLGLQQCEIDFKNGVVDCVKNDSIQVVNLGSQDLIINDVTGLSTPFNILDYPTTAISTGKTAYIKASFTPETEGFWKQNLSIVTNLGTKQVSCQALCSGGYTVEVPIAGQLESLVKSPDCDSITIYGYLNESDFWFMRNSMPNLKYLNLSAAKVIGDRIPNYALQNKKTLYEVVLPHNLKIVGNNAFDQCSILEKITFPKALKQIEQEGFSECHISGELVLPDSLISLGAGAFDVSPLTKVILPDSLKVIGDWAFRYCSNLQEVTFPKNLERIGQSAFYDCFRLPKAILKGVTPPTLESESFNYTRVFFVPKGASEAYSNTANWNNKVIIDGDTPVKVDVTLTTAGTLGEEILKHLEYVNKVNELVITGPLNNDDFYQIQNRMPNLMSIDMTNVAMEALPDNFFYQRGALLDIKLPKILKSVGQNAFRECYGLISMVLPEGLITINNETFAYCKALKSINLPSSLTGIGGSAFYECNSLQSIVIPDKVMIIEANTFYNCYSLANAKLSANLKEIKDYAFYNCSSLTSIDFPKTLTSLRGLSFYECRGLTEITLPASLQYCNYPFYNCSNIKKISSLASVPPTLEGNRDILYNVDKSTCELLVPFWSVNDYKLTPGWDAFPIINPANYEADEINIHKSLTLAEGIRPASQPTVSVFGNGRFNVRGTDAFSMKKFTQSHRLEIYSWNESSTYTGLISESTAMRADSVIYNLSANGSYWMYLSFPFDAKVSDIVVNKDALFVIRKYDGATRAQGVTNNWKNMTNDSTLHAGEGYIMQFNKNVDNFIVKAINNDNKNKLFSANALDKKLSEYTSEFAHNRSWNFVGNPYPCYYDIHYMNYSAPITVWNGNGYTALSLEDDNYILKPMQAFFVQKPIDVDAVTFMPEGRQMDTSIRQRMTARAIATANRMIYNLDFGNDEYVDKTRIVINPTMSMEYDMTRDAAKFMSDNQQVPQCFSLDASAMRYAINERPVGNGVVPIGIYMGKSGSYTFALDDKMEQCGDVLLVDKLTKQEILLNTQDYTFTAEPGMCTDRFEIRLSISPTGVQQGETMQTTQVISGEKLIEILTEAGTEVTVYAAAGQIQKKLIASQTSTIIPMEPGFYVVVVNGKSFKTVVTK